MLLIKDEFRGHMSIAFPTHLSEITPEVLDEVTSGVVIPKHYSIVALCAEVKLFDIATSVGGSKNPNFPVTNILAKFGEELKSFIDANVGDKVVIDRSSLERSIHLSIPISISTNSIVSLFKNNDKLRNAVFKGNAYVKDGRLMITGESDHNKDIPNVYVMEFKIVPNNAISALVPKGRVVIDPFVISDNNNN